MKHVYGFHLLSGTNELDWFGYDSADTKSRSASRIAVEFSQHNTVKIQTIIKFLCSIYGILTRHRVYDEQGFVWMDMIL